MNKIAVVIGKWGTIKMRLRTLMSSLWIVLFCAPLLANIVSVEDDSIEDDRLVFSGFIENPFENLVIRNAKLQLSLFQGDLIVRQIIFDVPQDIGPHEFQEFRVETDVLTEDGYDRYSIQYVSYKLDDIGQGEVKLEVSNPVFIRSENELIVYAVLVTNQGTRESLNPYLSLVVFDSQGTIGFFTKEIFEGVLFPQDAHSFIVTVPSKYDLNRSRFKLIAIG